MFWKPLTSMVCMPLTPGPQRVSNTPVAAATTTFMTPLETNEVNAGMFWKPLTSMVACSLAVLTVQAASFSGCSWASSQV